MIRRVQGNDSRFQFESVTEMRALPGDLGIADGTAVLLTEDGLAGHYKWDASSTATDDGVDIIKITAVAVGRFLSLKTYNQGGTGAANRTQRDRNQEVVSVKDFGALADGAFTAGGSASGTDNLAAFNAAIAAAVASGIYRVRASGVFYLSGKLTIPRGVTLYGDGETHVPIFLGATAETGTVLLINGQAGNDCVAFEENAGKSGLEDLSIFNVNTNAIRSVVSVVGQLYPKMRNVEITSLRKTTGSGLLLRPSETGTLFETLWGDFDNVVVSIADINASTEASVAIGLDIQGVSSTSVPNANVFKGGQFSGTQGGLVIDGDAVGAQPLSVVFFGTKFDAVWDSSVPVVPAFKSDADGVFGWLKNDCYIWPIVKIIKGKNTVFHGCYFEAAGAPATYDDTVNGSATLLATVWIDDATDCISNGTLDCSWNSAYLYDKGTGTLANPITDGTNYETRSSPAILLRRNSAQTIASFAFDVVEFNTVIQGDDSSLSYDATNFQVQIKQSGKYMINAAVEFGGWATANTYALCKLVAGGVSVSGVHVPGVSASVPITTTVNTTVSLLAGDTVQVEVIQVEGTNQDTVANNTWLSVAKV